MYNVSALICQNPSQIYYEITCVKTHEASVSPAVYKPNSGEVFIIFITTWSTKNRVCDKTLKQMAYQRHGTNSIDEGDDFFFLVQQITG